MIHRSQGRIAPEEGGPRSIGLRVLSWLTFRLAFSASQIDTQETLFPTRISLESERR